MAVNESAKNGWILDLRFNSRGNMWPMLAGLDPFLPAGEMAYFEDADRKRVPWIRAWGIVGTPSNKACDLSDEENIELATRNLAVLGLALWPVEKYEHVPRGTGLQPPADLDQKVGWYMFSDAAQRLVSFGETGGVTLNRFHLRRELLEQGYFERSTDLVFVGGADASSTKRLEFDVDAEGKVVQLRWSSDGIFR